jgi:hypothetical protein
MAISPNDVFTSGQILTATECNQFPFGIMAITTSTGNTVTSGVLTSLNTSFTALANRNYKLTVTVHSIGSVAGDRLIVAMAVDGAEIQRFADWVIPTASSYRQVLSGSYIWSPSAGTRAVTVVWSRITGTINPDASTGVYHQLTIEDVGPA